MSRPTLALVWTASCGGCDVSVLDVGAPLLELLGGVDVLFWPCAMDFKVKDLEALPDRHIDVCLLNGAIRTDEEALVARLARRKSKRMVAYGSCAHIGGIPGLANLSSREEVLERAYNTTPSTDNPDGAWPGRARAAAHSPPLELPDLYSSVRTLEQVVEVDHVVPGCPPTTKQTLAALLALTGGDPPPIGTVLGAGHNIVCDECPRERTGQPAVPFLRPHKVIPDAATCLLEQGLVCLGLATRSGCEARCLGAQMPCRGCYGPAPEVLDQGAKMMGALGSRLGTDSEDEIRATVDKLVDPAGTFYTFGLPASLLGGAWGSGRKR